MGSSEILEDGLTHEFLPALNISTKPFSTAGLTKKIPSSKFSKSYLK